MKKSILLLNLLLINISIWGQTWGGNDYLQIYEQHNQEFNKQFYKQSKEIFKDIFEVMEKRDSIQKEIQNIVENKHKEALLNPIFNINIFTDGDDKYYLDLTTYLHKNEFELLWEYPLIRGKRKEIIPEKFLSIFPNKEKGEYCRLTTHKVLTPGMKIIIKAKHTNRGMQILNIPSKNTQGYQQFAINCKTKTIEIKQQRAENERQLLEQFRMYQQYQINQINRLNSTSSFGKDPYSTRQEKCSHCNGKGWISGYKTTSWGGEHWCEECGRMVSGSHSHDRCPSCNGRGYINKAF